MKILAIAQELTYANLDIKSISLASLIDENIAIDSYDYIIISGGDGTLRRVVKKLYEYKNIPPVILNPTGSFNVISKLYRTESLNKIIDKLRKQEPIEIKKHPFYKLNSEVFLFSAGNMGDLQHILLSETVRFGFLQNGIWKYILSFMALFPLYILLTPFMLLSSQRFFIFTPFSFIPKIGSFYGKVDTLEIDLQNSYNILELDGDIVFIDEQHLKIEKIGALDIVVK